MNEACDPFAEDAVNLCKNIGIIDFCPSVNSNLDATFEALDCMDTLSSLI